MDGLTKKYKREGRIVITGRQELMNKVTQVDGLEDGDQYISVSCGIELAILASTEMSYFKYQHTI